MAYATTGRRNISSARQLGLLERVQMTTPGHVAQTEIDNHADTCCLGLNFIPLSFTGEMCDVSPYSDEYKPMENISICTGATAYQDPIMGAAIILIVHEALWFGNKLKHSLLNPNQVRANGFMICNDPFDPHRQLGMELEQDETFVSFTVNGAIIGFESYVPTNEEVMQFQSYEITSESKWRPDNLSDALPRPANREVMGVDRHWQGTQRAQNNSHQFDLFLSDTSSAYSDLTLLPRLISAITVHDEHNRERAAATESNLRQTIIEPAMLMKRWNIGLETATKTLRATT